jgi:hypothetical protein
MPIIHDHIVFHNCEELEAPPGLAGLRLQRFPAALRNSLGLKAHSRGRFFAHRASGCELRFVTEGKFARLSLSAMEDDAEVIVYRGDWTHSQHVLKAGVVTSLFLEEPLPFTQVESTMLRPRRFAPQVWRITFNQDAVVLYHHLDGYGHAVRPPNADEVPGKTWIAYGSSITFGGNALFAPNIYVQQAALRLGVDVLNKGLPGSCLCEAQMAEYLGRAAWDFATIELGVNLLELTTPEEFRERACDLLDSVLASNPERLVFALDIYPNRADYLVDRRDPAAQNNQRFRDIIRNHVAASQHPNLRHIAACMVLDELTALSTDLVHPSDEGHIRMGENIASILQRSLSQP